MRKQHEEFPSNSLTEQKKEKVKKARMNVPVREDPEEEVEAKEALKKVKRNITPPTVRRARIKKQSFVQRLVSSIVGNESDESVTDYILSDVLIPAAKSTIQDMVTTGIEMVLFGDTGDKRRPRRDRGGRTIVSYGSYYKDRKERREPRRATGRYQERLDGISFESRGEAQMVLNGLVDLLDNYETVTVADFYELASIENLIELTDNGIGWDNLSRARVISTRHGFEIDFPTPHRLD